MTPTAKFRLAALVLSVGLMGALIVLAILLSERQGNELRSQLNAVDSESFSLSEHFKDALRDVNNIRFRYTTTGDPDAWSQFLQAGRDLDAWMVQQTNSLTSAQELAALREVKSAYDDYLAAAQKLHDHSPVARPPAEQLSELSQSRAQSQRVFDLGQALARSHYESRNQVLGRANHTLTQLRYLMLAMLALLFIFGLTLAVMAYRDMVLPLRVKLVESQSLVERNEKLASLGLLAAGVAHEIRNPLTAIKAAIFIQSKNLAAGSQAAADVELVQREILRLERIVTDFLQFARPAEPELALVLADQPLKEVARLMSPALAKNNIRLTIEDAAPLPVNIDGGQIQQVLINLVQNAADSIGHDGVISLRARPEDKRSGNGAPPIVVLEVSDSGRGIPPEVEKRLFDPFFSTKPGGTGLGLSIAACIVEKHGGSLRYQARVNHGATFGIFLPQAAA
jgi:signal transduction histidine kinase